MSTRRAAFIIVAGIVALASCGGDADESPSPESGVPGTTTMPTSPVDVDTLTSRGGCGTVWWHALNEDGTARLMVRTDIPGADLVTEASHHEFTLTDDEAADAYVELEVGNGLDACDDVQEPDYRVDRTYRSTSGTVTVDLEPGTEPRRATGTVHLADVRLEGEDGTWFFLPAMTWSADQIGLVPG